ncbi:hypothetical protein GCM10023094_48580 [Rhodococcus olei]|uniref:Uncharacterized protein n=1 Tax=Rhodococcus olei TaxID=2161675 RepID=A0ABP8PMZ3_9NOCA
MVNGQLMEMNRIDLDVLDGAEEIWAVTGEDRIWPHNFHVVDGCASVPHRGIGRVLLSSVLPEDFTGEFAQCAPVLGRGRTSGVGGPVHPARW